MSGKILFIHGFGSCGNGHKARLLEQYFGADTLLAPDLPVNPAVALAALEHILDNEPVDTLVASSLGGYFAVWLNGRRPVPSVLINPTVRPWLTLAPHVGSHNHWCTGDPFELTRDHIEQLATMARQPDPARERYLVLLARGDEVLDYREAEAFFSAFEVRIEANNNHRFEHLEHHLPAIARFHTTAGDSC